MKWIAISFLSVALFLAVMFALGLDALDSERDEAGGQIVPVVAR